MSFRFSEEVRTGYHGKQSITVTRCNVLKTSLLKPMKVFKEIRNQQISWRMADLQSWFSYWPSLCSAGFTYRLDRLEPRASKFGGLRPRCIIFFTLLLDSHLCCPNVLYFLSNPSVIFLTQLHSISEYCRILNISCHIRLDWKWLNTLPSSSSREGEELGEASQME